VKKIYVVEGATGEYSDHREWPVRAFVSEKKAQEFVEKVSAEYRKLVNKYGDLSELRWKMLDNNIKNPLDPRMETDYTGTNYSYFPIDLDETIPDEDGAEERVLEGIRRVLEKVNGYEFEKSEEVDGYYTISLKKKNKK
jgi:hypothetical protein